MIRETYKLFKHYLTSIKKLFALIEVEITFEDKTDYRAYKYKKINDH